MAADGLPAAGQIVHARHRQWLVEDVVLGTGTESPLVRLVCLDDDDPGRPIDVLWDLELGARIVAPEHHGLGEASRLDPPAHFGAYLHALKWSAVSAADATRFQAPFRAGIKLMAHQLTPLMKALELPRANLFIADDVGLGKTIEAGLVLQELLLRQQASFVLIVCPASVCLQWQGEMQRRFGLRFEVMTRQFVAYRRQDRLIAKNRQNAERIFPYISSEEVNTNQGLTKTYNALKDPACDDPRILDLRRLHEEMDRAVLAAYGWGDIAVPPYCPRTDEDREALQAFDDEVIDHLYVLNAERAREEQRLGLAGKKKARATSEDGDAGTDTPEEEPAAKKTGKGKKPSAKQGKLFQ